MTGTLGTKASARLFHEDIHCFRAIAITLIVFMHSIELFNWAKDTKTYDVLLLILTSTSVLFFFISGYLFQSLSDGFDYRSYLKRKFLNIILPYLILSIPAVILSVWFIPQEGMWDWFYDQPKALQVLLFYATGKHLEPLWFVPAVTLLYLISPLLLKIDHHPSVYWVIPLLLVLSVLIGRDGPTGPLHKAIYMLPAYIIGMFASHYRETLRPLLQRYIWLLLAALGGVCYLLWFSEHPAGTQILFKILISLILWTMLGKVSKTPPAISTIAYASLGIYFIHGYILGALRLVFTNIYGTPNPFPGNLAYGAAATACVILFALLIIKTVQAIVGKRSRHLIGV